MTESARFSQRPQANFQARRAGRPMRLERCPAGLFLDLRQYFYALSPIIRHLGAGSRPQAFDKPHSVPYNMLIDTLFADRFFAALCAT
ncbi:hypothetical protein [Rhizobium sp. 9140]|uniref:hypothetical protein n=1 Tax=Rhizobium sp. 9140 TaxID=1761900 RepID=UPI000B0935E7|nr:hypothetical protein [Rhizobium sp. 9140]